MILQMFVIFTVFYTISTQDTQQAHRLPAGFENPPSQGVRDVLPTELPIQEVPVPWQANPEAPPPNQPPPSQLQEQPPPPIPGTENQLPPSQGQAIPPEPSPLQEYQPPVPPPPAPVYPQPPPSPVPIYQSQPLLNQENQPAPPPVQEYQPSPPPHPQYSPPSPPVQEYQPPSPLAQEYQPPSPPVQQYQPQQPSQPEYQPPPPSQPEYQPPAPPPSQPEYQPPAPPPLQPEYQPPPPPQPENPPPPSPDQQNPPAPSPNEVNQEKNLDDLLDILEGSPDTAPGIEPEIMDNWSEVDEEMKKFQGRPLPAELKEVIENPQDNDFLQECMDDYVTCLKASLKESVCAVTDTLPRKKKLFETVCDMNYSNCRDRQNTWHFIHDEGCMVHMMLTPQPQQQPPAPQAPTPVSRQRNVQF